MLVTLPDVTSDDSCKNKAQQNTLWCQSVNTLWCQSVKSFTTEKCSLIRTEKL